MYQVGFAPNASEWFIPCGKRIVMVRKQTVSREMPMVKAIRVARKTVVLTEH